MQNINEYEKILNRMSVILERLYSGEKVYVKDLAIEFSVSERTIQRDFSERLSRYPIIRLGRGWGFKESSLKKSKHKNLKPQEEIMLDIFEHFSKNISKNFEKIAKQLFLKIRDSDDNIEKNVILSEPCDKTYSFRLIVKSNMLSPFDAEMIKSSIKLQNGDIQLDIETNNKDEMLKIIKINIPNILIIEPKELKDELEKCVISFFREQIKVQNEI